MRRSAQLKGIVILVLVCLVGAIWYAAIRENRAGRLTVSFLGVGQGDAIFIDAPSGRQVLVDGGPDGSVLRALGAVMSPWDRSLDVVLASSADPGAVGGLVDVLQRYSVGTILQTGVENSTPTWNLFEQEAAGKRILSARRGQTIDLGGGAYIEILFPDRSLPASANADGCVVARVVYGSTSFLLPCIASTGVQKYLSMLDGTKLRSDVLLLAATQTPAPLFIGYVAPTYTVSACGKSAPSADTVATIKKFSAESMDTCGGTVTFVSDGHAISRK